MWGNLTKTFTASLNEAKATLDEKMVEFEKDIDFLRGKVSNFVFLIFFKYIIFYLYIDVF